jgi:hypothetical protein
LFRATSKEKLPLPCEIQNGGSLPGRYVREGDEELFPGDVLFEREFWGRRWPVAQYRAAIAGVDGEPIQLVYDSEVKARLKKQGLAIELLSGAGELAGLVRVLHAIAAGLRPYEPGSDLQNAIDAVLAARQAASPDNSQSGEEPSDSDSTLGRT